MNIIKENDKIYLYGEIKKINVLTDYFKRINVETYYLENINVKDLKYITKKIISFIKKNEIDFIYILDGTFIFLYEECVKNKINVLNNKIFFKEQFKIQNTIRSRLNIPIFKKTNQLTNYNNLVIESLEREFPLLLKSNEKIIQKINDVRELVIYKSFIENFIKYFKYNDNIYLEEYFNNSQKIIVNFINYKNEIRILNLFEVSYVFMEHNIIIKSKKLDGIDIYNDVKNIVKYFNLRFGYIEFIIVNDILFFNKITNIDTLLLYDRNLIKKIYNFDLFDLLFLNDIKLERQYNNKYLMVNELNFNYDDFLPFYQINNNNTIYKNKLTHLKKINDDIINYTNRELKNELILLIKNTENIFFKELILSKLKYVDDKLFIHNIFNEKEIYLIKILETYNDNYLLKKNNNGKENKLKLLDDINSKLGNYILHNNMEDYMLEIKDNDIKILFYNKTFITITGTENISLTIKDGETNNIVNVGLYKIITVEMGDVLNLNRNGDCNLNYICIKNGFKILEKNLNNQKFLKKNKIILFNSFNDYDSVDKNYILKKSLIPRLKTNIKLNVIRSGFIDYIQTKIVDFIFKNKWSIMKKNDNIILCKNKKFDKIIKEINIYCNEVVLGNKRLFKYPRGTVIINGIGLLIVNSHEYNYYEGYAIMNLIDVDIWQLNYLYLGYIIGFNEVGLEYASYKKNIVKNFFIENKMNWSKIDYKSNINKTGLVYIKRFDKNNMTNVEVRQLGDEHVIIVYKKMKKEINDNNYIEFAFRQKVMKEILNNDEVFINIINGYDFYLIKLNGINIEKFILKMNEYQNKILNKNFVKNKIINLPIVLSKKYFSDKNYLEAFLKINNLRNENELKKRINEMKFIVIEINSIENSSILLVPYNPNHRLYLIERNIEETMDNGSICLGNFFMNIYKDKCEGNGNIFCRTLPVINKEGENLLNHFDIIKFDLIENDKFNSIYNHFILGNYILDVIDNEFKIDDYQDFFNNGFEEFVKEKKIKLNNYKKYKKEFLDGTPNNLLNIHSIKCDTNIKILKVYVNYNKNIKFGDRICKVENEDKIKFYIKSNLNGLITKINIERYMRKKKGETLINILEY